MVALWASFPYYLVVCNKLKILKEGDTMNPIERILRNFPVIILDGAMATELESYGCNLNDDLWSAKVLMEEPELIKKVHLDYFTAGADVAMTASYQATIEGFMSRGLSKEQAKKLIQTSVEIAVEARDEFWENTDNHLGRPKPLVSASVGPYGAFLADGSEYKGNYSLTVDQLVEFHRERMGILVEAGADVLICETIPCLKEAQAIVKLLKEFPDTYAIISFSAKDGLHISDGEKVAHCAAWLDQHEQVASIGINCTPPKYIPSLIKEISRYTTKPIAVYPNSGASYNPIDKTWEDVSTEEDYGQLAKEWFELGASLIGGCCRTTPEDIQEIAVWKRQLSHPNK